jgi:hypothetical protein
MSSSSSSVYNTSMPSHGIAPPLAIFLNVVTAPGSPPDNQPPVPNTIVNAFQKQRSAKEKALLNMPTRVSVFCSILPLHLPIVILCV